MFCEYASAGKVLYGKRYKIRKQIPVWEAAKILTSRCGTFFEAVRFNNKIEITEKFPYAWSKSILAAGEALLILEGKYEFSIKRRVRKIRKLTYAKRTPAFLKLYQQAYICRYSGKIPINPRLIADPSKILSEIFEKTANTLAEKSGREVRTFTAPFPGVISTRFFYFINMLKRGRISVPFSEPLVREFEEMGKMFFIIKEGKIPTEKQRLHAVNLWKHAERFWLPY